MVDWVLVMEVLFRFSSSSWFPFPGREFGGEGLAWLMNGWMYIYWVSVAVFLGDS